MNEKLHPESEINVFLKNYNSLLFSLSKKYLNIQ